MRQPLMLRRLWLLRYVRAMGGNALPLSVRHFDPCVRIARMGLDWFPRLIGVSTFPDARRDGGITKYRHLQLWISELEYFVAFSAANVSALLRTFPSAFVFTDLSASSGARRSGLSSSATVSTDSPVPKWLSRSHRSPVRACDNEALPSESKANTHQSHVSSYNPPLC